MTPIDPALQRLVSDTAAAEESIPLDLYLPSGRLYGQTTSAADFGRWVAALLGQESAYTGTVEVEPDPEYVHLVVQPLSLGEESSEEIVRVRLSNVIAWTVG